MSIQTRLERLERYAPPDESPGVAIGGRSMDSRYCDVVIELLDRLQANDAIDPRDPDWSYIQQCLDAEPIDEPLREKARDMLTSMALADSYVRASKPRGLDYES